MSELADRPVQNPREVVKEGDIVDLRIIRVDAVKKRMGLSLRRANDPDFTPEDLAAPVTEETPEPK